MDHNRTLDEDYVRRSAKVALAHFYEEYKDRFELIGDPREHMVPLDLPGVPEDEEEVKQDNRPFPEVKWRPVVT